MSFTFTPASGSYPIHQLEAPYALLVEALQDSGLNAPRDDYKQMAQWNLTGPEGAEAEVYDYKVGTCYDRDGLELWQITTWHVQGNEAGIALLVARLENAEKENGS